MLAIKELNKWTNSYSRFYFFSLMRIALGAFLFYKGIQFMGDIESLIEIMNPKQEMLISFFAAHYIVLVHFAGGVLIFFGLFTRYALLVHIPILVGAVLVNFITVMNVDSLFQAVTVLLVSLLFLVVGSGKHSLDYNFQMEV